MTREASAPPHVTLPDGTVLAYVPDKRMRTEIAAIVARGWAWTDDVSFYRRHQRAAEAYALEQVPAVGEMEEWPR